MKPYIKVPIKIITPKEAKNKQNSVFYAGKNIAEVKVRDRLYILTTAGEYSFSLEENSTTDPIRFNSDRMIGAGAPGRTRYNILKKLTDAKIKALGNNDLVFNWGWFGLNVWETHDSISKCLPYPVEVWSTYDEALSAFIEYVEKDLAR